LWRREVVTQLGHVVLAGGGEAGRAHQLTGGSQRQRPDELTRHDLLDEEAPVGLAIGMRNARQILRDPQITDDVDDRGDIGRLRPAQHQPLGREDGSLACESRCVLHPFPTRFQRRYADIQQGECICRTMCWTR
jgi:hypothetical protein